MISAYLYWSHFCAHLAIAIFTVYQVILSDFALNQGKADKLKIRWEKVIERNIVLIQKTFFVSNLNYRWSSIMKKC